MGDINLGEIKAKWISVDQVDFVDGITINLLRPNVVLLPCRTQLFELNSTLGRQYSATFETKFELLPCSTASLAMLHGSSSTDLVSNVVLLLCRTQFINYKYI